MKKIIVLLMALLMLLSYPVSATETLTMHSLDGREISVLESEVEDYKNVGWYENKEDVVQVMYSLDGNEVVIYKSEVEDYKNVGWYENKEDVVQVMYSLDGNEVVIYKSEVEDYKNVGWYENKEDVVQVMYSLDGDEVVIYKSEVEKYKKEGWYENKDDVTVTMCSKGGKKITVYKSQVKDYQKEGWVLTQSDVIDPNKPMVALTYDDGPRAASTGRILDTLELYNAKATFFVVGNRVGQNEYLLQRANKLGCQIGNHTYSHPELSKLSSSKIASELDSTAQAIYNAIGKYPKVIRPPYGAYNKNVLSVADEPFILWSIDTLDWKYRNASYVTNAVLSNVKDGDIILMHDLYDTTAAATEQIVPALIEKGYQLVTVSQLAEYKNKTISPHQSYTRFR